MRYNKCISFLNKVKDWLGLVIEYGIFNLPKKADEKIIPLTPLDIITNQIHKLQHKDFDILTHVKYQLVVTPVLYHNIVIYNRELQKIVFQLQQNTQLQNIYKQKALVPIYLVDFFVNEETFVDRNKHTQKFLKNTSIIMGYYHNDELISYTDKYNKRILKYIVDNLIEIINVLDNFNS